jgi:type I restriction enzyme, S subunit
LTEGGDHDKLGRGALWRGEVQPCIHQNHVFRVRLNWEIVEPEVFESYLQTSAARSYFLSVAKRTTNLASINMTQLRSLSVPVAPREVQRAFVDRVIQVRSIETQQAAATVKARATFEALLGRMFAANGEASHGG